jgi:putative ABC transport system permease protein
MNYLYFSYKNVLRNKFSTIFSVFSIGLILALIIFCFGIIRGWVGSGLERYIDVQTSHLQIHHIDYEKQAKLFPLNLNIAESKELQNEIEKIPGISGVGRRIEFKGSLSNGLDRMDIVAVGIEPDREMKIGVIHKSMLMGEYLNPENKELIIGESLAELLNVEVGDKVYLYGNTRLDLYSQIEVKVGGIFSTGHEGIDLNYVYLPLNLAFNFLQMENIITEIAIRLENGTLLEKVYSRIKGLIYAKRLEIKDWNHYASGFKQELKLKVKYIFLFILLLGFFPIFWVFNFLSISIIKRKRELITLKVIGFSNQMIRRIIFGELLLIGLAGIFIGMFFGFILEYISVNYGISVGKLLTHQIGFKGGYRVYGVYGTIEYLFSAILGFGFVIIGGFWPILKLNKLNMLSGFEV